MENLTELKAQFEKELESIQSKDELLKFKGAWIGKTGKIPALFSKMKELPPEEKKSFGQEINVLKNEVTEVIKTRLEDMEAGSGSASMDLSLPGVSRPHGSLHPITQTIREVTDVFHKMGFTVVDGPEIETEFYNFEALNIPAHHPARDMQDTFFIDDNHVLRTQTSGVQIRTMEKEKPPIRIVAPGKVFRVDSDVTHSPVFHQIEGLMVDKDITFPHLKSILRTAMQQLFGEERVIRLRPSFFPFTEPSAEMDVSCFQCNGKGCRLCSHSGWIEVLGCGMVDPNVFKAVNLDPDVYTGWAFGIGVERIAMLKYGITDIRLLFENDIRFLEQFA